MSFETPEWLALAPALLLLYILRFRHGRTPRLRLLLLALAAFALSGPRLLGSGGGATYVLLVDRSASVQGAGLARAAQLAPELERAARSRDGELYVIGFGRGAALLSGPGESLDALSRMAQDDDSDLAAALQLAMGYSRNDAPAEVVLLSDGLFTTQDPRLQAAQLRARGMRVHPLAVGPSLARDSAISAISAPARVARGQRFSVAVEIFSPRAQPARLRLRDAAGAALAEVDLALAPGLRRYAVALRGDRSGSQVLTAEVEVEGDPRPGNNRARTVVQVVGPPRVVLYSTGSQSALARALASAGLEVEQRDPRTPLRAESLTGAAAVVLENIPLSELGERADETLAHYVRHLGGGLLVTGGRSSYAHGGYFRSQLEPLLPIAMDRKEELRRPRIELAIALDRSGSMGAQARNGALKMDLANRGAAEAIGLIAPGDGITVLAVDTVAHVVAPLERVRDAKHRQELIAKVSAIEPGGGGIFVYTALATAMDALLKGNAPTRHIVLFSDAADSEEPGEYRALVHRFTEAGGSLSVIGLGTTADSDAALLEDIAALGGGRAYFTDDAMQLPRVFAQEVMYIARKSFLEKRTAVLPARGLLSIGLPSDSVPDVDGYNLGFLAQGAEAVLVSGDDNAAPIAAAWQRGAGKVFGVTFEADGKFTGPLAEWPEYKAFFRSALEWIKRPDAPEWVDARVELKGRVATVHVELDDDAASATPPRALVLAPDDLDARPLQLGWVGPRSLAAEFELDGDGVYSGLVQVPGRPPIELPPLVLPYSPEFALHAGAESGDEVLGELARATGGEAFTHPDQLARETPARTPGSRSLVPAIAAALLLVLLLEIAVRRGLLDAQLEWLTGIVRRAWRLPARFATRVRAARAAPPSAAPQPESASEARSPAASAAPPAAEPESPYAAAKRKAKRP